MRGNRYNGLRLTAVLLLAMFAGSLLTLLWMEQELLPTSAGVHPTAIERMPGGLTEKQADKIDAAYRLITREYLNAPDSDKLVDGAIEGMLASLGDPHSVYMDADEAEMLHSTLQPTFQGVGAEVMLEDGRVTVISAIRGSPAEKAGLRPRDVILSVNGESLQGLKLTEAVAKIRGPKGSQAKLEVLRGGTLLHLTVVRDDVDYETVYAQELPDGLGEIEIRQFAARTQERFLEELNKLEKREGGLRGLVIDLRDNPGGVLTAASGIAEPFIPNGEPIVHTEGRDGERITTKSTGSGRSYPIVVLVNGGSASASEVLAAALREKAGARIVGERTYGKGTVQYPFDQQLGDGSVIKMTIKKWLTPTGNWVHEKGIAPDVEVAQPAYYGATLLTRKEEWKFDANSPDVRNVQLFLQAAGYDPRRTDGYFDRGTEAALVAFQTAEGLPANGTVDAATADRLEEAAMRAIRDPERDAQRKAALGELRRLAGIAR
ncbi:S41 family peptidase [Paenibacillus thermoaerophilus]|uniref:S41 family peptidase n=1 Tax=Paenibacillus thermoaerophilus TaxID=1215385 RepID=A0ABW2V9I1_9BACL|nr:S41 family peptidase [Paenibacillus thermoaerophilus]TMV09200.1 PDZ domain-containing protein [Paenibacillus thermoaerophilus]